MAGTAVMSFDVGKHRVLGVGSAGGREYFRMAKFAAIPDGMLLMREGDRVNPFEARFYGKVSPTLDICFLDGYAWQKVNGLDDPVLLRSLPVNPVNTLWALRGK